MKKVELREVIRKIIKEELEFESKASDDAKRQGLEYMGFGRYGKDGVVTHTSKGGTLTPVAKSQPKATKQGDWEDWGGGLAYHPGKGTKAEPAPSADDEKGDMEIDGMYFNKQKVKAANPELWKKYTAAKKVAGGEVYIRGGKFYKQKPIQQRDTPEPVD